MAYLVLAVFMMWYGMLMIGIYLDSVQTGISMLQPLMAIDVIPN